MIGWEEKAAAATSICDLSPVPPQARMGGSEVAAGRLLLPNGLPDFVVEAPDGADPYPHAPRCQSPRPTLGSPTGCSAPPTGSTAWVYVAHTGGRACRLCAAGLGDGCECSSKLSSENPLLLLGSQSVDQMGNKFMLHGVG